MFVSFLLPFYTRKLLFLWFWWGSKLAGALTFEFPIYSLMLACQKKKTKKVLIFKMGFIRFLN